MRIVNKYLTEKKYDVKGFLKDLDKKDFTTLKDHFYGVKDHINELFNEMNKYPELRDEASWVKKANDMFSKITLGKYL
jgi:uncharacterized protein YpbB